MKFSLILFFLLAINCLAHSTPSHENEDQEKINTLWIGPYLQDVTRNSIIIIWETTSKTRGYIRFGEDPLKLNQKISESEENTIHKIKLNNLESGKTYFYQCKWGNEQTQIFEFKTAPPANTKTAKIVVYGDTRSYAKTHLKVAKQMALAEPDIILHSGDFIMYGVDKKSWKYEFFDPAEPFISKIPLLGVPGNHEMNSSVYDRYFVHEGGKTWWSKNYGSVHIIGLDSNVPGGKGSEQYDWLIEDLEKNKNAKWKVVLLHHPLFGCQPFKETESLRWEWHPVFQKYGVDLVFNSHNHYYARNFPIGKAEIEPTGVVYINSAGGGAPFYPSMSEVYVAYRRSIHHFVELNFNDDEVICRAIDSNGNIFDSFIINKSFFVGTGEIFAYDIVLIEKELNRSFKVSSIKKRAENFEIDLSLNIPTDLNLEVIADLKCVSHNWNINSSIINKNIKPGEDLEIEITGSFDKKFIDKTPEFIFDIHAKDTFLWGQEYTPAGFKNTQIRINLEDGFYNTIMNGNYNSSNDALNFLNYFKKSQYSDDIINRFYQTAQVGKEINKESINLLNELKKGITNNDDIFRYYPLHFLLNDFSVWDEWITKLQKRPIDDRTILRQNLIALPKLGITGGGLIRNWYIMGVFDNPDDEGFFRKYPPEDGVSLNAICKNSYNEILKWTKTSVNDGEQMNFAKMFDRNKEGVVYAYCEIQADKECEVPLLVGSDDGIVIWVNGEEIYRHNEAREAIRGQDIIIAHLKQGTNKLLVKVNQFGGGWGMFVDIIDRDNFLELP